MFIVGSRAVSLRAARGVSALEAFSAKRAAKIAVSSVACRCGRYLTGELDSSVACRCDVFMLFVYLTKLSKISQFVSLFEPTQSFAPPWL